MLIDLVGAFPGLSKNGFRRTSLPTPDYNCLAWVFNDTTRWWEPDPFGFCFWPKTVRRTYSVQSYIDVCRDEGYVDYTTGDLEPKFEKIVIYTSANAFRHIAKQLPDGMWTSKLGQMDDIRHTLDGVEGKDYGQPSIFLRRDLKA